MAAQYEPIARNEHEADFVERERDDLIKLEDSQVESFEEEPGTPQMPPHPNAVYGLYFAHFLGTFGDRMWQFAVPYLFTKLWDEDMTPQSVYCLILYLASFVGMIQVGKWLDCTPRLVAVRTTIVLEAVFLLGSVLFFWLLLENVQGLVVGDGSANDVHIFEHASVAIPFFCLLMTSILAELMTKAGTIALERDWLVEIANGDAEYQTHLNSWMRRVDLCCKLGGPFVFVALDTILQKIGGSGNRTEFIFGIVVVAGWNILSCPLELYLITRVYNSFSNLRKTKDTAAIIATNEAAGSSNPIVILRAGLGQYYHHPVFLMSLSYCQLWFTVVDNGTLMTAFLVSLNVNPFALVAGRGIGAMFGIVGTFAFPYVLSFSNGSLRKAGALSLYSFVTMVALIAVCFLVLPMQAAGYVMLVAVVFSRGPLWSFDLAVQQIMQEGIEESQRGVINGVHSAVCQLMLVCRKNKKRSGGSVELSNALPPFF